LRYCINAFYVLRKLPTASTPSGVEHVPLVSENPAEGREFPVEHPPFEIQPRAKVVDSHLVLGSLCGFESAIRSQPAANARLPITICGMRHE
ncbi:hypothetical protein, partial [Burkholderia pseudomallei]|uniref:hypothetical protein n=1 Tax=Burkholderia pseudomallei TaxID=28450 RepID=UPI001C4B5247